jgi:hypothetical protein
VVLRLGWEINETLFSSLKEDESFYAVPDKLRHPLIFYITHPAVFYINKLREVRRPALLSHSFPGAKRLSFLFSFYLLYE